MLRLSKSLRDYIPIPNFTTSRLSRRANMAEYDRAVFYYSNLFCIVLTALPIAYLFNVNYWSSEEQENLHRTLEHLPHELGDPNKRLEF